MRPRKLRTQNGSFVVMSAMVVMAVGILMVVLSQSISRGTHQSYYLDAMNRAYHLAESGMNKATGQLILKPKEFAQFNNVPVSLDGGEYQNFVVQIDSITPGGYYIMTSATVTLRGRSYACLLHTHARLSNASDYFAAVADELALSDGIDISQGRIYSPKLTFATGNLTRIKSADFVATCNPPLDWTFATKALIDITEPTPAEVSDASKANQPTKLKAPIIFPQVLEVDLDRYEALAGPHTVKTVFTGEIYPPGYKDGQLPGDNYDPALHTDDNAHHIYYSDNDIRVEGTIHGQILFVSKGAIIITGNLLSADPANPLPGEGGAGHASSSTAHQAILVTRTNVTIDNTFYQVGTLPNPATQRIQALVMAPQGELLGTAYTNVNVSPVLSLEFTGSLILGHLGSTGNTALPSVFGGGRTYLYMQSLKDSPPPYLPAILDIIASIEQTTAGSMY